MKRLSIMLVLLFASVGAAGAQTVDFEDLNLDPNSYWNGMADPESGGFTSGGTHFNNVSGVDETYGYEYWYCFAYSNQTDTEISGFEAQYNAIPGSGIDGSETYAIAYWSDGQTPPTITLSEEQVISGFYFTNTNYAYYSMLNGDAFAKKFVEEDFLKVIVSGYDQGGFETGSAEFFLAQNGEIVKTWKWVDLSRLGPVKKLEFTMFSTDNTAGFMNTPSYFAMDDFNGAAPLEDENDDSSDSSSTCFIRTGAPGFFSRIGR